MSASPDPLLTSLLAAVEAAPADVPLRVHVAGLLLDRGRAAEALQHASQALAAEPGNAEALGLLTRITTALTGRPEPPPAGHVQHAPAEQDRAEETRAEPGAAEHAPAGQEPAGQARHAQTPTESRAEPGATGQAPASEEGFWSHAEQEVADIPDLPGPPFAEQAQVDEEGGVDGEEVLDDAPAAPVIRLADVAGLEQVKERLELAFLGPMRNPELARAFGASLSGGLLLYGPPGCGKTYLARAVAGELGASFSEIGIADVLEMWTGRSERNLAEIFRAARRRAPHVLFFDEVDALGQKRSNLAHSSSLRNTVNQLLTEMDSLSGRNDGVYVLGATNHPWDVDPALRRPGRFDRMLLVLPPDAPARAAILRQNLLRRPIEGIDLDKLVKATEHYSGADITHLCDTAAERALAESMRTGKIRPLRTRDLLDALKEVQPSTGPWFTAARNVVTFGNTDGSYDDLAAYLKRNRSL